LVRETEQKSYQKNKKNWLLRKPEKSKYFTQTIDNSVALANIVGDSNLAGQSVVVQPFLFRNSATPYVHINSFLSYNHKTIVTSSSLLSTFVTLQKKNFCSMIILKTDRGGFYAYSRGFRAKLRKKEVHKIFFVVQQKFRIKAHLFNQTLTFLQQAIFTEFPLIYVPFILSQVSFFAPYKRKNFSRIV